MVIDRRCLVIGGSGFIGGALVEVLVGRGAEVTVFDRTPPFFYEIPPDSYRYVRGDIRDREAVLGLVYGADEVYHLAGVLGTAETFNNVSETADINVMGAVNVWDAIKMWRRKAVYITIGNDWENPYTITKAAAARLALMYNHEFKTKISVVRGLNVYGPRQRFSPVNKYFPRFCVSLLEGSRIPIFGDGEQEVDMVYVGDTARALIKAMETDFGQSQYEQLLDTGTGQATSVNEVARMVIAAHLGIPTIDDEEFEERVEYLPLRPGEPKNSRPLAAWLRSTRSWASFPTWR